MTDQNDTRTREELLEALRVSEALVATLQAAQVRRRREKQLRQALPGALARALWETRMYHRSVLTGRCCVAAGW